MTNVVRTRKKLIEVALPLPEINDASAYDKMPGIGPHPKGIHQWWARLPLPVARAVLFASIVDDPSGRLDMFPSEEAQSAERERLFEIMRRMMQKQLHKHPEIYAQARTEMLRHCDGQLPRVFDPFAGGGSIPLEASRLGFEAHAGDLNPVAVLLCKCALEHASCWSDRPPINPKDRQRIGGTQNWRGTNGLAADVRHYGQLIADQARKRSKNLYPPVYVTAEIAKNRPDLQPYVGKHLPVIAWIWARTVPSPNPAARGVRVPLISTFWLSSKKGSEIWLEAVIDRVARTWHFDVRTGSPNDAGTVRAGTKAGRAAFACVLTGDPISNRYIDEIASKGELRYRLIATVAQANRGRLYLPAIREQEEMASLDAPDDVLTEPAAGTFAGNAVGLPYGFREFRNYYTARQLATMAELSDLVRSIREQVQRDAIAAGLSGEAIDSYSRSVVTFLALAVDRCADFNNSLCRWSPSNQKVMNLFGRQAIPMVWDFAEANILGESVGAWVTCSDYVADCIEVLTDGSNKQGRARQIDAATGADGLQRLLVSTDPPYYDNIGYASLSDFFYVWLRRTIGDLYPDLFRTMLVPKVEELTASPQQFEGDKQRAKDHFERGFRHAFLALRERMDHEFPLTVYYAFKQDDEDASAPEDDDSTPNAVDLTTGWETMLEALIGTRFQITATWPVRASQKWRMVSMGTNALASYIVLACRPRAEDAPQIDRRSFVAELRRELPTALKRLQQGNIAPVDFAQAAIGPGMAIYSRYSRIVEASGQSLSVRNALALINQTLTEVLSEQEDEFDSVTRWAIAWFEQHGFNAGDYGDAELLSKAKVTSVEGLNRAGIINRGAGKVQLLAPARLSSHWDPERNDHLTVWEVVHHLIRVLESEGESGAAALAALLGSQSEGARELAYRLYSICERKKRTQEALSYNALVQSWPEITRLAREGARARPQQAGMFT